MTWDEWFFDLCQTVLKKSKDTSTKVGAIIVDDDHNVVALGYNGLPRGVNDLEKDYPLRHQRPYKYFWYEHAERNAIYNAARIGVPLKGCILYVPWHPCADCARGIIQVGIRKVVVASKNIPDRWKENCQVAKIMLMEAGVEYEVKS